MKMKSEDIIDEMEEMIDDIESYTLSEEPLSWLEKKTLQRAIRRLKGLIAPS